MASDRSDTLMKPVPGQKPGVLFCGPRRPAGAPEDAKPPVPKMFESGMLKVGMLVQVKSDLRDHGVRNTTTFNSFFKPLDGSNDFPWEPFWVTVRGWCGGGFVGRLEEGVWVSGYGLYKNHEVIFRYKEIVGEIEDYE